MKAPTRAELTKLTETLARRIGGIRERLCRHISRPAIVEQRMSLAPNGSATN